MQGSGFKVCDGWFRGSGLGQGHAWDLSRAEITWGAGCRVQGAGCRVQGAGCRVQVAGCMPVIIAARPDEKSMLSEASDLVWSSGLRVEGVGLS